MKFEIARTAHARCAPEDVMALVTDPKTWADWQPEIKSAAGPSPVSPGDVVTGRASMLGFKVRGHATSVEVSPDHYLQDVIVGIRLRVRYEVRPDGDGTEIVHRLTCDLPRGLLGKLLSVFLRRRLRWMQRMALRKIATRSEAAAGGEA